MPGVAAVSGVGKATMQDLHDYATSGAWTSTGGGGGPTDPPNEPNENCAFGLRYPDIFTNSAMVVIARRVIDPGSSTNATQRTQIVAAAQAAYPNVTTVSQAFAAVDDYKMNHVELWDASNRKARSA